MKSEKWTRVEIIKLAGLIISGLYYLASLLLAH